MEDPLPYPSPPGGGKIRPSRKGEILRTGRSRNSFPASAIFGVVELDAALAQELADVVRASEVAGGPSGSAFLDQADDVGIAEGSWELDDVQDLVGVEEHRHGACPLGRSNATRFEPGIERPNPGKQLAHGFLDVQVVRERVVPALANVGRRVRGVGGRLEANRELVQPADGAVCPHQYFRREVKRLAVMGPREQGVSNRTRR